MRPLQHLTFEVLRDLLRAQFQQVPDARDPRHITWELHDVLMSGFAMFYFQHPSLLQFQQSKVFVNFVEVWERDKTGQVIYHNAWVTDFDVTPENVATVVGIGRSRWKIENEQFNVQKNHGYELEHNFGHGERGLSLVMYLLNLLAFLAHEVLEMSDGLYRACCANESRRSLWNALRVYFRKLVCTSWQAMLEFHLSDEPLPDT